MPSPDISAVPIATGLYVKSRERYKDAAKRIPPVPALIIQNLALEKSLRRHPSLNEWLSPGHIIRLSNPGHPWNGFTPLYQPHDIWLRLPWVMNALGSLINRGSVFFLLLRIGPGNTDGASP